MATNTSLGALFVSFEVNLKKELQNLYLPTDSAKVEQIISSFFSDIFENSSEYRQSLTESEDLLLLSVLQILKAQQNIVSEISKSVKYTDSSDKSHQQNSSIITKSYAPIIATGTGAIVGGLFGTWAAIAGSIAGCALSIYYASNKSQKSAKSIEYKIRNDELLDVDTFVEILKKICENIDGVIATYRVQVQKVKNSYERRNEPSFLVTYSALAEQIANVCTVAKAENSNISNKLSQAIGMLEDSLENYDLSIVNGSIKNTK